MSKYKDKSKEILSMLDGYHEILKMIHWSTTNNAEHILTDRIDKSVLEYQDKLAESIMGDLSIRFGIGDLKSLLPSSKDLNSMLKELEEDIKLFRKINEEENKIGVINILDDLLTDINKWKFISTLK